MPCKHALRAPLWLALLAGTAGCPSPPDEASPRPAQGELGAEDPQPRARAERGASGQAQEAAPLEEGAQAPRELAPGSGAPLAAPIIAGQEIAVPAGRLWAGSLPGSAGRSARSEADLAALEIPAFRIDRLPYPNDPALPPRVELDREEAARLCEAEGKRLCEELEWERACKADTRREFPSQGYDLERCALDAGACDSPLGISSMGVGIAEWTASAASQGIGNAALTAVIRGAGAEEDLPRHRCGARRAQLPSEGSAAIGFRCCRGPAPGLAYPEVGERPRFRPWQPELSELRALLRQVPELARFADSFELFSPEERDRALACGGFERDSLNGWELLEGALRWSPSPGEEVWIVAGRSADSSLVLALYPLEDGSPVHGASFILAGEIPPLAIAFTPASRAELLWGACWGRAGESGAISLREDGRVVITQR